MNRQILKLSSLAIGAILCIVLAFSVVEENSAGDIMVIQNPFTGNLSTYTTAGPKPQWFGNVTKYQKENTFWFVFPITAEDSSKGIPNEGLPVVWNDGGKAVIGGSIRYTLPTDHKSIIAFHAAYRNQENLEASLIKPNVEKAVYFTGPLLSSKESYAEKKNEIINYIEDQLKYGVYKTKVVNKKQIDPITNEERNVAVTEIVTDNRNMALRQESSPIRKMNINAYNLSIKAISYNAIVEEQIRTQQASNMLVQTAVVNAKKAQQDAITTEEQGKADAAKAKWEQEVLKAKLVTEAEAKKKVAELEVMTAELNKRKEILEGEGVAAKKRLIMQADGALEKKLETYIKVQERWAEAFEKHPHPLTPTIVSGGTAQNAGLNFLQMMDLKAMKDLSLDMSVKK